MFSSPGDNRAEPCEHTTALHPDALTFLSVMSEIWGASYTLAVICFSCVGVSGSLPVCACLLPFSSSPAHSFFTHCWTRCHMSPSARLWNSEPRRTQRTSLASFSSLLISLSKCIFVWIHLAIFIIVFLPVYPFGLPVAFSLPFFFFFSSLFLSPCAALSCTNERMTDVGVGWEMEPVIYFPVFCRARLRPDSPRPDNVTMRAFSLCWDTHVGYSALCPHTHTHTAVALLTGWCLLVSPSGS